MIVLMVGRFTTLPEPGKKALCLQNRSANYSREDKTVCPCRDSSNDFPAGTTPEFSEGELLGRVGAQCGTHLATLASATDTEFSQFLELEEQGQANKRPAGQHDPSTRQHSQGPRRSCSTLYELNRLHSVTRMIIVTEYH